MVINEKISYEHFELEYSVAIVFPASIHLIRLVATAQNPNAFSSSQSCLTLFLEVLSAKQLAPLPDIPTPNKRSATDEFSIRWIKVAICGQIRIAGSYKSLPSASTSLSWNASCSGKEIEFEL